MPDESSESAANWLESLKREVKSENIPYIDDEDIELSDIGVSVTFSSDLIAETSEIKHCNDEKQEENISNKLFASIFRKSKRKKSMIDSDEIRNK